MDAREAMESYRYRMNGFIFVGIVYLIGAGLYLGFASTPSTNGLVLMSTMALFLGMAVAFDAIFMALRELSAASDR